MPLDERDDFLREFVAEFQVRHDPLRDSGAGGGVPVKAACAGFVKRKALRLSAVVQQHRHAQLRFGRNRRHGVNGVAVHIVNMNFTMLVKTALRREFRNDFKQHFPKIEQHALDRFAAQQLDELFLNAFRGDIFQKPAVF